MPGLITDRASSHPNVPTLFSVVGLMSGFVLNFNPFLIRRSSLVFPNSEDFGAAIPDKHLAWPGVRSSVSPVEDSLSPACLGI